MTVNRPKVLNALNHQSYQVVGDPVLFDVVFTDRPVKNYRDTFLADGAMLKTFNVHLREKGLLKGDAKTYPCLALTQTDLDQTAEAIAYATGQIAG